MESDASHQQWVSKVKLRMPRHIRGDAIENVPLVECRSWPQPSKWYEARQEEVKRWKEGRPRTVEETMEIARKDLALVQPLFSPARYTAIVEGGPVQAQLYKPNPLWAPTFLLGHGVFAKKSEHIERAFMLSALSCVYRWA